MSKSRYLSLALAAELALFAMLSGNARAQQPTPAPSGADQGGGQLQQITVTGYVIPRVGEGPQPVTTIDRDYITKQAYQTVTDVLQSLPSAVGNFAPSTTAGNSFSPGSASISLHGLNPNYTLVLVDGKRMPAYPFPQVSTSGVVSFVDINSIPLAAVDRIEILNDGGSAVYGSDAVAGVVNIITKQNYNGVDISNYFGITQRGDAETYHASLVGGISEKLGSIAKLDLVTTFDYYEQSPIDAADRWYSANPDHTVYSPKYPALSYLFPTAGSFVGANTGNVYTVAPGTTPANGFLTPGNISTSTNPNYSPQYWQIQPRETRYGGLVNANITIGDYLRLYDQLLIQRNEESSQTPNQGFSAADINAQSSFVIPTSNPYNLTGEPVTPNFPGEYLPEFGPWRTTTIVRTIRNVVGATLTLPHEWIVDANFQYAESDGTETVYNAINKNNLSLALAGQLPGHIGQYFNPFIDEQFAGNFNQQFYNALRTQQWEDNRTSVLTWHISAGGTLIDLPSGPLTIAGGLEYRSEEFLQAQDQNSKFGNITSNDFPPGQLTNGRSQIETAYGDIVIPILGDRWSWPGARSLIVDLQERYDHYATFGGAAKPKIAVSYKPIKDLTVRFSYDEGFSAPSLAELFGTPIPAQTNVNDPHFGGQSFTVLSFTGGNPHLKPENSYGYFGGAVWTPDSENSPDSWWHWANGFSAYVDWWQINIRNLIGNVQAQTLVDLEGSFPGAVVRNSQGVITTVNATFQNLGDSLAEGWDFGASYVTKEYGWGKLDFEFNGTYYQHSSLKQFIGANANGTPRYQVFDTTDAYLTPDFKYVTSLFYSKTLFGNDTFRTGLTLNWVDSEHDINDDFKGTNPNATLDAPGYVHRIGEWYTVDWQISYELGAATAVTPNTQSPGYTSDGKRVQGEAVSPKTEGTHWGVRDLLANTTITFGIKNIGDNPPPFSADWYQGWDTQDANAYGRYYYFQIEKKF